ncbi:MAG: hypothetical protein NTY20_05025 [Candidatus Aenigmarchaeota archaeon]|jgi:hypothetical protein|nr:hypothetical protein [Candidatus Aenigmarchaeota archaeon]
MHEKEIIVTGYSGNTIQFLDPEEGNELCYTSERFLKYLKENFDVGKDIVIRGIPGDLSF